LLDLDQVSSCCQILGEIYLERMEATNVEPSQQSKIVLENLSQSGNMKHMDSPYDHCLNGSPLLQGKKTNSNGRDSIEGVGISDGSALFPKHDLDKINFLDAASEIQNACVEHSFPDDHCKTLVHDESNVLTEEVTDDVDSSSSSHERDQPEDREDDEMLGGLFAFSE
jgi:hypothetical protein